MLIDRFFDGHIHTSFCRHATGTMEQYVQAAIHNGLRGICFLEHMEESILSRRITWLSEQDFDAYFSEGRRLQQRYGNDITIDLGVEVGFNPDCPEKILDRIEARAWDTIGLSCHFHRVEFQQNHLNLVSKKDPVLLQLEADQVRHIEQCYYRNLRSAVETIPAGVLCHLDAAFRYHPGRNQIEPPWGLIEEVLDAVKKKDMAVEMNTSGIMIRGEIFPQKRILKMIRQRAIPLSAGSDAHRPEDVGRFFHLLEEILND